MKKRLFTFGILCALAGPSACVIVPEGPLTGPNGKPGGPELPGGAVPGAPPAQVQTGLPPAQVQTGLPPAQIVQEGTAAPKSPSPKPTGSPPATRP